MSMRTRILEATSNLIRTEGMSAVTTKKIAAEAGCAEGSIFRNFGDKGGLLAAVLSFGLPETQTLYDTVDGVTGSPDVRAGLTAIAEALLGFYRASYPLVGSALADRELFTRYSQAHRQGGTGPLQAWQLVHGFLESQRSSRRLPEGPDLPVAALALAGACQNAVWVGMVNGADGLPYGGKGLAAKLADGLLAQLGGASS
jgi:AcrR family transcriptional regulator